ncbi:hypothetical protein CFC21_082680 [Triticum aestivum]|uniref:Uncharacterized protein n=3 Tax=Triticum TaxID=4564 RepID=A0A9R1L5C2_WHEAT|nr:hypothetical protein CFC21_082667 [Triticum aestivum]KAF7078205.1 hypothetical protein CFC21_082680 [Triticum aestivum]VAI43996.1 unnamed protein product [Triticum turgidum subsp. durum]VAI43999.1 unnamed protein product [Triticum turgidum subsp. durum]
MGSSLGSGDMMKVGIGSSLGSGDTMNVGPANKDASESTSILARAFGFLSGRSINGARPAKGDASTTVRGVAFFSDATGPAKSVATESATISVVGSAFSERSIDGEGQAKDVTTESSSISVTGFVFFPNRPADGAGPAEIDACEAATISAGGLGFLSHRSTDGARLAGLFQFSLGVSTRPRRSTPPFKLSARRSVLSVAQLELREARPGRSILSLIQLLLIEARPGCCFLVSSSTRAVYTAGGGVRRRQRAGVGNSGGKVAATWLAISAKHRTQQRTERPSDCTSETSKQNNCDAEIQMMTGEERGNSPDSLLAVGERSSPGC